METLPGEVMPVSTTSWEEVDPDPTRVEEAQTLLQQRGIVPGPDGYTIEQLTTELARRGWRWRLGGERAEAEKAYTPTGTVQTSFIELGPHQVATLALVLAHAVRFDEEQGLSPPSPFRADLVVRSPAGTVVALAEARNRESLTQPVAIELRRNLVAGSAPRVPFFLLASQDSGFVWKREAGAAPQDPPAAEFPMRPVVAHYLPWLRAEERLHGSQLELVLAQWLADLANGRDARPREPEGSLTGTGFIDAMAGASIHHDERP